MNRNDSSHTYIYNALRRLPVFRVAALLAALCCVATSTAQGLRFANSRHPIEQRTSYSVFAGHDPSFAGELEIAFDLSLYTEQEIGYIIRIKDRRSGAIYNLFYNYDMVSRLNFRFNHEGYNSLIKASVDRDKLMTAEWFPASIRFDLQADAIHLTIDGETFSAERVGLPPVMQPEIVFGRSDYLIDVPSFAIRDLRIGNDAKSYEFELREHGGERVHDTRGRDLGRVTNPAWLINDAYHWHYETSFSSQTGAGVNYNPQRKEFYFFNRDTLWTYNAQSGERRTVPFAEPCPVSIILGRNFLDSAAERLYVYEVYYEKDFPSPDDGTSVASLDLKTFGWKRESTQLLPMQLHHHSMFFDPEKRSYTVFGGFGNMHFSNEFHTYSLDSCRWQRLDGFTGDELFPRYFASMGYNPEERAAYVFGGMGNRSGEQIIGRVYCYDFFRVDFDSRRIDKLWEIPWSGRQQVPVRSLLPDGEHFYTLCYPESQSQSWLRLYRFDKEDGEYEILGDSIPIHSDKITTNANLYYDRQMNRLFAAVQEFEANDRTSTMKIYSLVFPPITERELTAWPRRRSRAGWWLTGILLSLGCGGGISSLLLRRRRRRAAAMRMPLPGEPGYREESAEEANSILLFGDFTVRDRRNKDITYLFSPRLKQTFCLILEYSAEEGSAGISSQQLSGLLWPDEPKEKAKNLRNVTINNLRKILAEMEGIELLYGQGCFRIVCHEGFHCDYLRCQEILAAPSDRTIEKELLRILARGKFLKGEEMSLYDSLKGRAESRLEPLLRVEMERAFAAKNYLRTLRTAEALFNIDPWNDDALGFQIRAMRRLKRGDAAYVRYLNYTTEYKRIFGTEYPKPFKEL